MNARSHASSRGAQTATLAATQAQPLPNEATPSKIPRRHRRQSYIAQAFFLFNVWGIPLSFGPYLEYYYNITLRDRPVLIISLIVAIQLCCIFIAGVPVLAFYQHKYWRTTMILATVTACTCQWTLHACKTWWILLLVQGFGVGLSLGVLYAVGTLCLGSHYMNNQPLSSMMSVSAGLAGATVYTAVALICLADCQGGLQRAYVLNAIISSCTLSVACVLFRRSNTYRILKSPRPPRGRRNPFSESGTILFLLGYLFLFVGLFIYPLYSVLLISSYPSHTFPTEPTKTLLGTYGAAMLAAPFSANRYLRTTLGPVNSLIAATVVAAACLIAPAWIPYSGIALPFNIVYGVALGAVLSLHTKALSVFHWSRWSYHDDMAGRAAVCQAIAGVFIAVGVVWTAWVVDHTGVRGRWVWRDCELGFGVAMSIGAVTMLVGAVFMALGRWRRCPGFFVVI